jgi:hypothetical protein
MAILQQLTYLKLLKSASVRWPDNLRCDMRNTFVSFGLLAPLFLWSAVAWSADATGFTLTHPCGSPPFGAGETDMELHLTHFPKQRSGQELVIMMPSILGPSGVTDWADSVAKLCRTSGTISCSIAQRSRVRVLNYSARYVRTSGRFEVGLRDGTVIEGSFTAKERQQFGPLAPVYCE